MQNNYVSLQSVHISVINVNSTNIYISLKEILYSFTTTATMESHDVQLSDMVSLGKELTTVFEGTREAELSEKCASIITEIRQLQQKQREQLKQQIQGMKKVLLL